MDTSKKLNQKGLEKLADFTRRTLEEAIAQLSADPTLADGLDSGTLKFKLILSAYQGSTWQNLSSFRDCIVQCDLYNGSSYEYIDLSSEIVFSDPKSVLKSLTLSDTGIKILIGDLVPDQIRLTPWHRYLIQQQSLLINSSCHLSSTDCHIELTLLFFPAADEMEII